MKIGVMNGPNLGRLGQREPDLYGAEPLADLQAGLVRAFPEVEFAFFQSNHEGALIDQLEAWHEAGIRHLVINPGALTHQSYALRDALAGMDYTAVEVHITNIHGREWFRHRSLTAPVVAGQISGLGVYGYHLAVDFLTRMASAFEM